MTKAIYQLSQLCILDVASFRPEHAQGEYFAYVDVSALNVSTKTIVKPKLMPVSEAPSRAQKIVKTGDILVSNVRPSLNAVAKVSASLDGAVCSSAFTVLRCGPQLDVDFLYCFVQAPLFVERLSTLAHGAHYPAVSDRQVLATEIQLPHLIDQSAIAKRLLSSLEAARSAFAGNSEQCEISTLLQSRILLEGFLGIIPVNTQAHLVAPPGFEWHSLQTIAKLESGHTPSRRHLEWWGGDEPWLALPDIRKLHGKVAQQTIEYTNASGLANSSARLLPVNTVCVSRTASIGFVTLLGRPMATSQDFCNWICDPEKLDAEFLMYAFMASQDYLRELGSGAVHKTIYMPTIESFHVCVPDLPEQRRIARRLRERLAAAEMLQAGLRERLAQIEQLPQRILAAAFGPPDHARPLRRAGP
jgi:type I restriction enzyme S subunit